MMYPQVEQFETRDRELRAVDQSAAAARGRSNALQRLVALTLARVAGR